MGGGLKILPEVELLDNGGETDFFAFEVVRDFGGSDTILDEKVGGSESNIVFSEKVVTGVRDIMLNDIGIGDERFIAGQGDVNIKDETGGVGLPMFIETSFVEGL